MFPHGVCQGLSNDFKQQRPMNENTNDYSHNEVTATHNSIMCQKQYEFSVLSTSLSKKYKSTSHVSLTDPTNVIHHANEILPKTLSTR